MNRAEGRTQVKIHSSNFPERIATTMTLTIDGFKGDIVTPEDPSYAKAIARWAGNAERKAAVVAYVKDNADVAAAIKYARANGLPIAVVGGGHSVSGASSTEGGVVVDQSRYMNKVTIDPSKKLAYVGGGSIWETVDKAGIEHGLATVGGTVNHVSAAHKESLSRLTVLLNPRLVLAGM